MGHSPEQIRSHLKIYWVVYFGLMVLTAVTVGVSYLTVSISMAVFIALLVASIKGYLVSGFFMHLLQEKRMIFVTLFFTAILFVVLMFLPLLSSLDSRGVH